jgi:hypothetical protein
VNSSRKGTISPWLFSRGIFAYEDWVAMDRLLYICLPAIPYGIATQQALELVYAVLPGGRWLDYRKPVSKSFSLIAGVLLSVFFPAAPSVRPLELLLAGLTTAASSEAWNAVIKLLVYNKEIRKARAAHEFSAAGVISLDAISRK